MMLKRKNITKTREILIWFFLFGLLAAIGFGVTLTGCSAGKGNNESAVQTYERLLDLVEQGKVHGSARLTIGGEAAVFAKHSYGLGSPVSRLDANISFRFDENEDGPTTQPVR